MSCKLNALTCLQTKVQFILYRFSSWTDSAGFSIGKMSCYLAGHLTETTEKGFSPTSDENAEGPDNLLKGYPIIALSSSATDEHQDPAEEHRTST